MAGAGRSFPFFHHRPNDRQRLNANDEIRMTHDESMTSDPMTNVEMAWLAARICERAQVALAYLVALADASG
jgi:hypothetical protein